jgi:hypothetical protein
MYQRVFSGYLMFVQPLLNERWPVGIYPGVMSRAVRLRALALTILSDTRRVSDGYDTSVTADNALYQLRGESAIRSEL